MDREQAELQSVWFFGIIKKSFKTIFSRREILIETTPLIIFPLSFLCLSHIQVSLFKSDTLDHTQKISLFKAAYFTFLPIISLLSIASVFSFFLCTISFIYIAKEITFKKVISVVLKLWRTLVVTSLWTIVILLVYNLVTTVLIFLLAALIGNSVFGLVIIELVLILYLMGFLYLIIVWPLACSIVFRGSIWNSSHDQEQEQDFDIV